MNNSGESKRIADSTKGVLLCYSFFIALLVNLNYNVGDELDNFEFARGIIGGF